MAQRNDVTNTMLKACEALLPQVKWGFNLTGARKSNFIEGTISCDQVEFEWVSKDKQNAKAQYSIIIIQLDGDADVDSMADTIFNCFNDTIMGGLVYRVNIKRIAYGAIQGLSTSKVVKLELDVEYPVDL